MYEEDRIAPDDHRRRFAKVTLYLEIPAKFNESSFESYVDKIINDKLFDDSIVSTGPCEAMVGEVGSDDPADFDHPVGFIAPDGKFYLMESEESGLAHIELAPIVQQIYEEKGMLNDLFRYESGFTLDYTLERAGFVKVHNYDVRYLAHLDIGGGYRPNGTTYTPDLTQAQIDSIVRYGRLHGYEGCVFVNGRRTEVNKIKQADELSLRKIFGL